MRRRWGFRRSKRFKRFGGRTRRRSKKVLRKWKRVNVVHTKMRAIIPLELTNANTLLRTQVKTDIGALEDHKAYTAVYEKFKINGVSLRYIPTGIGHVMLTGTTGSAQAGYPGEAVGQNRYMYVNFDPNTYYAVEARTLGQILQHANTRIYNSGRPWKYYRRMTFPIVARTKSGNDTYGMTLDGFVPTERSIDLATNTLAIYYQNYLNQNSGLLGTIIVTYYVTYKIRRSVSVSS